jgi:hypothetical protein
VARSDFAAPQQLARLRLTCAEGGSDNRCMAFVADRRSVVASWSRVGRYSGCVAAAGFFIGTVLYLLDATHALGASPAFHKTAAGPLHDEATYWVAYFAHQHHILWDIIARDTLLPLAFLATIALSLAVANVLGWAQPAVQLMVAFFFVGGILAALADLTFLAGTEYWRITGWSTGNAVGMVAVGRSSGAVGTLTRWPEAAGFITLAAALALLGRLCHSRDQLPSRLGLLVNLEALMLAGAAISSAMQADNAYNIFSLLTGALVGPAVALWVGLRLEQPRGEREVMQPSSTI